MIIIKTSIISYLEIYDNWVNYLECFIITFIITFIIVLEGFIITCIIILVGYLILINWSLYYIYYL